MINELNLINNFDILFENKIVLYGAGNRGEEVNKMLKRAGIPTAYFCDSNPNKQGNTILDTEIISIEKLKELDQNEKIIIIITSDYILLIEQIIRVIKGWHLNTENVFTAYGLELALFKNINHTLISDNYRNPILATKPIKELLNRNYYTGRMFQRWIKCINNPDSLLIYQPAKVGSLTIEKSLDEIYISNIHLHYFNVSNKSNLGLDEISNFFKCYKNAISKKESLKIITLVREPISRDLSHIFQDLEICGPCLILQGTGTFIDSCNEWISSKVYELKNENRCHGYEFDWFDHELKAVFGVDIFEYPFDKEKGYSVIKQDNIEVLVMKLEKLNSLESVIGEFVGAPHFKLINANESDNKLYKYLYKNVREVIKIPREIVDLYYKDNPRMDHFYTEEEKAEFLKKWENNIAD